VSRKKKHGKHHPHQRSRTKHLHAVPTDPHDSGDGEQADPLSPEVQPLLQGIRQTLRSDHPVELLMAVSSLMSATDPRMKDPFRREDEAGVTLGQLVDSFVGVDYAETTAALTVLGQLVPDDLAAARIEQVLKARRQPMPVWLTGLETTEVVRVVEMTHVLGDGDDYFLEVCLPGGEAMTALVYVDHNMGGIVKDAFVIAQEFSEVEKVIHANAEPGTTVADLDAAVARAELIKAIDWGARTFPQPETDTWPAARPLVEWLVRMLPAGGSARGRREWADEELEAMREEFFASTYAEGVDGEDERSLLETILWYATDYGSGDPLRWSNVRVEILLADWLPRKVVADVPYLAKVPALLRRYVEFSHDKVGFQSELTQEVLDAVDQWEPEYQRLIRSERPHGAAAVAGAVLDAAHGLENTDDRSIGEVLLEELDRDVGDRYTLMNLDTSPLPDEAFEWSGIPEDTHERVRKVLELCDRCAEEFFDVEHRTAFRRFLSRAAVADPQIFRRKAASSRAAAAVCWTVASANRTVGRGDGVESGEFLAWFGVKGSISQRAEVFLRANGVNPAHAYGARQLGAPDLLTAARREDIAADRDRYLSWED
jgi:hypothetical protein